MPRYLVRSVSVGSRDFDREPAAHWPLLGDTHADNIREAAEVYAEGAPLLCLNTFGDDTGDQYRAVRVYQAGARALYVERAPR